MKPRTTFVNGRNPWAVSPPRRTAAPFVYAALAERQQMKTGELVVATGFSECAVRLALQKGIDKGTVRCIAHGTYAINQVAA